MAHPEHQPRLDPSAEDYEEMSFAGSLANAVDTLFTYKTTVERLQDTAGDENIQTFVRHSKQALNRQLEETAWSTIKQVVADLDLLQAGGRQPFSATEYQDRVKLRELHKPFIVASVCREDLGGILTEEEITRLSEGDMERIVEKMGDAYRDSGGYWESLEIMAEAEVKPKKDE